MWGGESILGLPWVLRDGTQGRVNPPLGDWRPMTLHGCGLVYSLRNEMVYHLVYSCFQFKKWIAFN